MAGWYETFRERVAPATFFARFIEELDSTRQRKYKCVFHPDDDPSLSVDPVTGVFHCFGATCQKEGGMLDFYAAVKGYDLADSEQHQRCIEKLCAEFGVEIDVTASQPDAFFDCLSSDLTDEQIHAALDAARARGADIAPNKGPEPIPEDIVSAMAAALWAALGDRARRFLIENRGLSEDTLRRFEIGWSTEHKRIAFPIRDDAGRCVNVSLYSPRSRNKFLAYAQGYGRPRMWPLGVIASGVVVLAEGQIDALTAIQNGFAALTTTGGASVDWRRFPELAEPLRGKDVVIAYDRDTRNTTGESKVSTIADVLLDRGASSIRVLEWPDEIVAACGGEKADINDYFVKTGANTAAFQALLDTAKPINRASLDTHAADRADDPSQAAAPLVPPSMPNANANAGTPPRAYAQSALERELWPMYFRIGKGGVVATRKGISIAQKAQAVIDHIANRKGTFFYYENSADAAFVLEGRAHVVAPEDEAFKRFWHDEVRLFALKTGQGEELMQTVAIGIVLRDDCTRVPESDWGRIDWKTGTLFLALDPSNATIIKIEPTTGNVPIVHEVPNGTDGVMLRCPTYRTSKFNYVKDPNGTIAGLEKFRDLVHRQQALDEIDRVASTAYNLAAIIPQLAQRPLKVHTGAHGSGKTTAIQVYEIAVYAKKRAAGFAKPQELWMRVDSAGPLVTHDNAESDVRKKFADTYARIATGGSQQYRKLFLNRTMIEFFPKASVVITAIESFAMPEEIDRAIEFAFDTKHHDAPSPSGGAEADDELAEEGGDVDRGDGGERAPITELERTVAEHSHMMLSAILDVLSIAVLPGFNSGIRRAQRLIARKRPNNPKRRFSEFIALMFVWVEAIGAILWDPQRAGGTTFNAVDVFMTFLDRQRDTHQAGLVASSRELQFLDALRLRLGDDGFSTKLPGVLVTRKQTGECVIGPITTGVLFTAFSIVAKTIGQQMVWGGPRQLGQRLGAAARVGGALELAGWSRSEVGTAHGSVPLYTFEYTPTIHAVPNTSAAQSSGAAGGTPSNQPNAAGLADHATTPTSVDVDQPSESELGDFLGGGQVQP